MEMDASGLQVFCGHSTQSVLAVTNCDGIVCHSAHGALLGSAYGWKLSSRDHSGLNMLHAKTALQGLDMDTA